MRKDKIILSLLVNGKHRSKDIRIPLNGGFHDFTVSTFVSHNTKGTGQRWFVRSSGRRNTVITFLFLKWLWDELTSQELRFFLNLPEFFKTPLFEASFKARAYGVPKKEIREKLIGLSALEGTHPFTYERYRGMRGLYLLLELQEVTFVPTPKYSGYTRHYKDKGSLRSEEILPDEMFSYDEKVDKVNFFFSLLSVGYVHTATGVVVSTPDESSKKKRNR